MLVVLLTALAACNSDEEEKDADTLFAPPTDVAVNAFSLTSNAKVLKGLDSVYFSIDLNKAVIYNADSLPKGTDVSKLVPKISYSQYITSAIIEMTGGEVRSGSVDYRRQPGDSIDFTGRVVLTLTSSSGNSRSYELKVNVHEMEPDSLFWDRTAVAKLPSRLPSPRAQRTVQTPSQVLTMLEEADGSFTLASTTNPETDGWQHAELSLPFVPRIRTFTATDDALYMLDTRGTLYSSTDGRAWSSTGHVWTNILGSYAGSLMGLRSTGSGYSITSLSALYPDVPLTGTLADFPIEDFTNLYSYRSKWMQAPVAVLAGGVTSAGSISDRVYGFDGNSWALLSQGQIPALRGATLIPYYSYVKQSGAWVYNEYSTLLMAGGLDADGAFSTALYLSYNNGVTFAKGSSLMSLPSYIPGVWQADNAVLTTAMKDEMVPRGWTQMPSSQLAPWYRVSTEMQGSTVHWECPYIYLFGGCDANGMLYDTVWRGVINRLTFTPIL